MPCNSTVTLDYFDFEWLGDASAGVISYRVTGTLEECSNGEFPDLSHFTVGFGCPLEFFPDEPVVGSVQYFLDGNLISTQAVSVDFVSSGEFPFDGIKFEQLDGDTVLKSAACGVDGDNRTHDAIFTFLLPEDVGFIYQECCVGIGWVGGTTRSPFCEECITGLCCSTKG